MTLRLSVVEPDGSGGLIHYAYQLSEALAGAGHQVRLITGRHYELSALPHRFTAEPILGLWPAIEPAAATGARPVRIAAEVRRKLRRAWRAVRYAWAWEQLTRLLLRRRPDVVILSVVRFPIQAFWLRRMQRGGLVLAQICHEFERRESRHGPIRLLTRRWDRAAYACFAAIFLHGEANRRRFLELHPVAAQRTHVIPHGDESFFLGLEDPGGDLRGRYGIPSGRPVALFFGGLRPSKGIDDLIDAFAAARREVDASLVVAGQPAGVDPAALERRVRRHDLAGDVVIDAGYLPLGDVGPLLRTATVVVLPYRSATASGVLQTAYAFGRPVIVTDVGGLPDAVEEGGSGLIVPPADPDALARALVKLLSDPAEAESMGRRGRDLARRSYGWAGIALTVSDVCRRIAGGEA